MKKMWKDNWDKRECRLRNVALKSFNHKCYFCEREDKKLEIHHRNNWIRWNENGNSKSIEDRVKNNQIDNLILMCHSCHQKLHKVMRNEKIVNLKVGTDVTK